MAAFADFEVGRLVQSLRDGAEVAGEYFRDQCNHSGLQGMAGVNQAEDLGGECHRVSILRGISDGFERSHARELLLFIRFRNLWQV